MAYIARNIKDRIADGDDQFYIEDLGNGKIRLIPAPNSVEEPGTPLNKDLFQLMEDRIVWLMNQSMDEISTYSFVMSFGSLQGSAVTGVWNEHMQRIEC